MQLKHEGKEGPFCMFFSHTTSHQKPTAQRGEGGGGAWICIWQSSQQKLLEKRGVGVGLNSIQVASSLFFFRDKKNPQLSGSPSCRQKIPPPLSIASIRLLPKTGATVKVPLDSRRIFNDRRRRWRRWKISSIPFFSNFLRGSKSVASF